MARVGRRRAAALCAGLMLASLALAGCREDEQDRVLTFEPGEYQGEPDDMDLSESTLENLNERALIQQF